MEHCWDWNVRRAKAFFFLKTERKKEIQHMKNLEKKMFGFRRGTTRCCYPSQAKTGKGPKFICHLTVDCLFRAGKGPNGKRSFKQWHDWWDKNGRKFRRFALFELHQEEKLFFLMKLEQSETSKFSTIPVSPIMSLFNQFSTRSVNKRSFTEVCLFTARTCAQIKYLQVLQAF